MKKPKLAITLKYICPLCHKTGSISGNKGEFYIGTVSMGNEYFWSIQCEKCKGDIEAYFSFNIRKRRNKQG